MRAATRAAAPRCGGSNDRARRISETELHAFVDGELTPEDRAEMEALLAAAPAEAGLVREFRDLNEAIALRYAARLDEPVPQPMQRLLARMPGAWHARSLVRRLGPLAAGLLVALSAGAGRLFRARPRDARRADHDRVRRHGDRRPHRLPAGGAPSRRGGAAEEAHLVQWLTKRIGANVRAPGAAALGWKLVGGRLLPDRGLPAAQFMYEDATGRRLTLYIRKETGLANTSFRFYERDGFGAFYWIDRPLAYALAGRLGREELMASPTPSTPSSSCGREAVGLSISRRFDRKRRGAGSRLAIRPLSHGFPAWCRDAQPSRFTSPTKASRWGKLVMGSPPGVLSIELAGEKTESCPGAAGFELKIDMTEARMSPTNTSMTILEPTGARWFPPAISASRRM